MASKEGGTKAVVTALVEVAFEPTITVAELETVIDRIEARIREVVPGARCYIAAEGLRGPLHATAGAAAG